MPLKRKHESSSSAPPWPFSSYRLLLSISSRLQQFARDGYAILRKFERFNAIHRAERLASWESSFIVTGNGNGYNRCDGNFYGSTWKIKKSIYRFNVMIASSIYMLIEDFNKCMVFK